MTFIVFITINLVFPLNAYVILNVRHVTINRKLKYEFLICCMNSQLFHYQKRKIQKIKFNGRACLTFQTNNLQFMG